MFIIFDIEDVGFEVLTAVGMKSTIFWDVTPCSPLRVNRRFGGTCRLRLQGRINNFSKKPASKQVASTLLVYHMLACWFLAENIPSTLKMEAICSSETSVDTRRTTRRYIPEVDTLQLITVIRTSDNYRSFVLQIIIKRNLIHTYIHNQSGPINQDTNIITFLAYLNRYLSCSIYSPSSVILWRWINRTFV
jgi:hypothetical protein